MDEKVHVFEKTLSTYQARLMSMPWDRLKSSRFFNVSGKSLSMPFFNEIFHVSEKGILSQGGPHASFDVSVVIFNYLLFNQEDEDFPASCKVLFSQGVDQYFDPESLAILADYFIFSLKALHLIVLKCAKSAFFDFYPKGFTGAANIDFANIQ